MNTTLPRCSGVCRQGREVCTCSTAWGRPGRGHWLAAMDAEDPEGEQPDSFPLWWRFIDGNRLALAVVLVALSAAASAVWPMGFSR